VYHRQRIWSVATVANVDELIDKLTSRCWTLCTGFRLGEYFFLNDAFGEDRSQEYAVVKDLGQEQFLQIESVTVSAMDRSSLARDVAACLAGQWDGNDWALPVTPTLQSPHEHGRCPLCA
jgi:hypothetical protein